MNIDFSAITSSPIYENEKKTVTTSGKKKAKIIYLFMLFPPLWIPLIVYAIIKIPQSFKHNKLRKAAFTSFAQTNGYSFEGMGALRNISNHSGPTFELPYEAAIQYSARVMAGQLYGFPFTYTNTTVELQNYHGISSSQDRNRPPTRDLNIFRVQLPVSLPKLFADAKYNNIRGFQIQPRKFAELEEHVLEGDFPTYYDVKAERSDRIDVLSVLSPDVMQVLKDNTIYDLWINGNELMLIANGSEIEYFAAIPLVFNNVDLLLREIDRIRRATQTAPQTFAQPAPISPIQGMPVTGVPTPGL